MRSPNSVPYLFPKPRLVLSQCLELDACRYDGASIRSPLVRRLEAHVELLPVCPEVAVGLGVPREPIRLVGRRGRTVLIQPATGRDLTEPMDAFASRYLSELPEVEGFLLKSRSPSCGIHGVKVFPDNLASTPQTRATGKFATAVMQKFPDHPVEHEGRLTNPRILDHFLTGLFALAGIRHAQGEDGSAAGLAYIDSQHQLTRIIFSSSARASLDQIVTDGRSHAEKAWRAYMEVFRRAWAEAPQQAGHHEVIRDVVVRLEERTSLAERKLLEGLCEEFRAGRVLRSEVVAYLRNLAEGCGFPALASQAYLNPFPESVVDSDDLE